LPILTSTIKPKDDQERMMLILLNTLGPDAIGFFIERYLTGGAIATLITISSVKDKLSKVEQSQNTNWLSTTSRPENSIKEKTNKIASYVTYAFFKSLN
jgi:hypothetical protein